MLKIPISYQPTGDYSSQSGFPVVFKCTHERYENEDAADGRVFCLDCDAKGITVEEEVYEYTDEDGHAEVSYDKWIEWL